METDMDNAVSRNPLETGFSMADCRLEESDKGAVQGKANV